MNRSFIKLTQVAALIAGSVVAMNAVAADGQIRIGGTVLNKTCDVTINKTSSSAMLTLDAVTIADLGKDLTSANGTNHKASGNMRDVEVILENCSLPSGKTKVAVSFDSTGYADASTSTYRNILLDSVNTMDSATKGVQIGFTKPGSKKLQMNMNDVLPEDHKDLATGAVTYNFETHYVQTAATTNDIVAGHLETVATFSLVYL